MTPLQTKLTAYVALLDAKILAVDPIDINKLEYLVRKRAEATIVLNALAG